MDHFLDSTGIVMDGKALAERMDRDGYVFIRGLFRQAGRVGKTPVDDAPGKVGTALMGMGTEGDHEVEGD